MGKEIFQEVYPFTTEVISGYFNELDFKDKSVMTLGSSSDQAFNALLLGAKKITVYDINENTAKFGKLKRDVILNSTLDNVWINVIRIDMPKNYDLFPKESLMKMNPYMKDEESFKKLQELLRTRFSDIEYKVGNIMEVNNLDNELFDINITPGESPYDRLKEVFNKLKDHLKEDGIIQLLYHYAFNGTSHWDTCASRNLVKVLNTIYPDLLSFIEFDGTTNQKDCAFIYEKKR